MRQREEQQMDKQARGTLSFEDYMNRAVQADMRSAVKKTLTLCQDRHRWINPTRCLACDQYNPNQGCYHYNS